MSRVSAQTASMNGGTDSGDINFEKFAADFLPRSIRSCKREIVQLEAKLVAQRAKLEKLVQHATIEGLVVNEQEPTSEPAPKPELVAEAVA